MRAWSRFLLCGFEFVKFILVNVLPDSSSFSKGWPSSSVTSVKAEHWFLGAPSTKSKSAFRQGTVFFRLCPGEVSYFCFSFCEVFTREARNDLAEPVEVNAFETDRTKAFPHWVPTLHNIV